MNDQYASEDFTKEYLELSKLPEPLRLAAGLEKTMQWPLHGKAADCLRKMHAELERLNKALEQQQPEGWKLVPVNPTEEMLLSGLNAAEEEKFSFHGKHISYETTATHLVRVAYRAILAAAPTPRGST